MIIREMTSEDVQQVAEIEAQCFSVPWSEQSFLDSIAREDTIFLVVELPEEEQPESHRLEHDVTKHDSVTTDVIYFSEKRNGTIAGYIGMYISFEEGEITNVAVSPDYRNQGIGNQLVTAMQSAGKEKNLERIVLEVRVSNANAISLYKGKKFTELGIRKNFYEKPTEDATIMACEI